MRIPDSIIEQLNSQADLVGMIRKHTTLKPAGREFKGCCPFHGEKTPSFYVNPETNLYYCFGCHAKGNPITFLKEFERLSFIEAVKTLSEQTGIELPKDDGFAKKVKYNKTKSAPKAIHQQPSAQPAPPSQMPSAPSMQTAPMMDNTLPSAQDSAVPAYHIPPMAQPNPQGDLYQLLDNICHYYQYMLQNTPVAKRYFLDRGVSENSIQTFRLGYAPNGWQHLEEAFSEDIEGLKILGLVRQSQNGRDYDLLRNRVIFPIRDKQGRVVGFAGRSLGDEMPKYINSSESPVFQKQHILYGLYEARQQKASDYMMVEGYMDVIALYQAGIYGAVAPMGTAANENQIAALLRYNNTLTLCFDGDSAGQRAAWRTMEIAAPVLEDGKTLKFLTLPDGHDPDSFLRANGSQAMSEQLETTLSLSDYVYQALNARFDLEKPENKAAAMAQLRSFTELFPKGSSYRWWLNSDIYQKIKALGNGHSKFRPAIDRVNYAETLSQDSSLQLCLCILLQPTILQNDPLMSLMQAIAIDQAAQVYQTHLQRHNLAPPPLPSWSAFEQPMLLQVIEIANKANQLPFANNPAQATSFMMAALDHQYQEKLKNPLEEFWRLIQQLHIHDLTPLFNELLSQLLKDYIDKQIKQNKHLVWSEIYKRQLLQIKHWEEHVNKSTLAQIFENQSKKS